MRTGSGTKGTRHHDWAMLEVTSDDTPGGHGDGHSVLLARRHRYTGTLSFYRCWAPGPVPLSRLIAIAVARWRIEEDHQLAKQSTGLDAGQVIRWKSWHRWTAICLLDDYHLGDPVYDALQECAGTHGRIEESARPDVGLVDAEVGGYLVPVPAVRDTAFGDPPLDGLGVYLRDFSELVRRYPPLQQERSQSLVRHSTHARRT
jgi:hypothetical protein